MQLRGRHPVAVLVILVLLGTSAALVVWFLLPRPHAPIPCSVMPHYVPKYKGVASLRFAMVHDVLTERYPRHGPAYYEERNRLTRQRIMEEETRMKGNATKKYFELIDDLGAGLDMLGRHQEAVAVLRAKLKRQQELGQMGMDLYSTYANLGTFIILWEIHEGLSNKDKARAGLKEGVSLIHKAIAINPRSHFGREIWQAVILEYLLAVLDNPELAVKYDMVGNALDLSPFRNTDVRSRRPINLREGPWLDKCAAAADCLRWENDQQPDQLQSFRKYIAELTPAWNDEVRSSHTNPVPFDEPTLGIIGMWRLGGGPNPFFAVALGEIMVRVGQDRIAWNAYERAFLLSGGVGPREIQEKFRAHCRASQRELEKLIPADEASRLRPSFEKDLRKGVEYQKAYQTYEAMRIKEGVPLNDPHFYDLFESVHGSIASLVGDEDRLGPEFAPRIPPSPAALLIGAGLFALAGMLIVRWRDSPLRKKASMAASAEWDTSRPRAGGESHREQIREPRMSTKQIVEDVLVVLRELPLDKMVEVRDFANYLKERTEEKK